jgi:S1-C subfamily serine protease
MKSWKQKPRGQETLTNWAVGTVVAASFALIASVIGYELYTKLPPAPEERPSTLRIESTLGQGSGVRIGKHQIITAAHVVTGNEKVTVIDTSGAQVEAKVVWTDVPNDIALLIATPDETVRIAPLMCIRPTINTPVWHQGYPLGQPLSYFHGAVVASRAAIDPAWSTWSDSMLVNFGTGPGSSGGPIYSDGRVVGILVGAFSRAPSLIIAIPGDRICQSMKENSGAVYTN